MKLIVQLPCFNERDHLEQAFRDLPREIDGVDVIEVLVVDDGSTDGTAEVARAIGVHHIVRLRGNRGLAAAFMAGIDAAFRLGADVIVNTDADNQYVAEDIHKLLKPIVTAQASVVIGDRQVQTNENFSPLKRRLQLLGSAVVRRASGTAVADAPSGFRAFTREAAGRLFVHNRFTYTLETIIAEGRRGAAIENVPVRTNQKTRESRLFKSIPDYLRRAGPVIVRSYMMYRPLQTFISIAALLLLVGLAGIGRFLYFYFMDPRYSGHVQSLVIGIGFLTLAFLVGLIALVSDLIAANRRLLEDVLRRTREIEHVLGQEHGVRGVETTSAAPWLRRPT